jgi:hypothetical protein
MEVVCKGGLTPELSKRENANKGGPSRPNHIV